MTSTLSAVPGGSFFYDANDRLTTDIYDANGNTISSGGISYSYDFENRLLMRGAVTIVYDGDGNRVSEAAAGVTTKYLVDDLNPTGLPQVLDEIVNGSVTRTYAYGLDRVSESQPVSGTWTPSFYGYDGHGNVRFLTNTSAAVGNTYQFDGFGNQIASAGTTPNSFLYSGEAFDNTTNLYQLRDRWYRPTVGRFITRDPVEGMRCSPLSFNPYIYGSDDPVNRVDPTGRSDTADVAILEELPPLTEPAIVALSAAIACALTKAATGLIAATMGTPIEAGPCGFKSRPSCESMFPNLIPVGKLPFRYVYKSEDEAFYALQAEFEPRQLRKGQSAKATGGPCPVGGDTIPAGTAMSCL